MSASPTTPSSCRLTRRNPGNSGGARVNTRGELVGVNTVIYSRTGGSVASALPPVEMKRVVDAAVNGSFRAPLARPRCDRRFDIARSQGLTRPSASSSRKSIPMAPPHRFRRGDLITAIDDHEVFDEKGLKFLAAIRNPGEVAKISLLRNDLTQVTT